VLFLAYSYGKLDLKKREKKRQIRSKRKIFDDEF